MDKELTKRWVAALRGGEYPQTKGRLHRKVPAMGTGRSAGYCCLGVLCRVAGLTDADMQSHTELDDSYMLRMVRDAAGIGPASGCGTVQTKLMELNDDEGWTFAEIADWIEENVT